MGTANAMCALCAVCAMALALASAGARADVVVAQVAPMTGPIGVEGTEYNSGIRLALAAGNASGAALGQRVTLETADDEYNPEKTVAAIRKLAHGEAVALLLPVGSPAMTRVLAERALDETGFPVIGVVPGAEPFRTPHNALLFHVRAGDLDQYRKLVEHSLTIGYRRIGVVYVDIPFGKAGLAAVEVILREKGLAPAAQAAIGMTEPESLAKSIAAMSAANPDLVLLISPAKRAGEFVAAARDHNLAAPISTLSYGQAETLCRIATPEKARGVGLAQVFPNVRNRGLRIVREYQDDLGRFGPKGAKPSLTQFEGYVATRVLLEALRRAGKSPTRPRVVQALNSMHDFDLGGLVIDFSERKHTGSRYVDISIIGRDCQLVY